MALDPEIFGDLDHMRAASGTKDPLQDELALKVAKTLQSSFSKQTGNAPRKWRDVPAEEQKVWLRLSRTAMKIVLADQALPSPAAAAAGATPASSNEAAPKPQLVSPKGTAAPPAAAAAGAAPASSKEAVPKPHLVSPKATTAPPAPAPSPEKGPTVREQPRTAASRSTLSQLLRIRPTSGST